VTADEIAAEAEFFSFGTNDLTQMTLGFSRDDVNSFLPDYLKKDILERDPFQSIDTTGVGVLMQMAVDKGQKVRPGIKLGICGEHGGDPDSVKFCHRAGLTYVSCSPFRVPVARLAAAQAAIEEKRAAAAPAVTSLRGAAAPTKAAGSRAKTKQATKQQSKNTMAKKAAKKAAKKGASKKAAKKGASKKAASKVAKAPAAKKAAKKAAKRASKKAAKKAAK
jgi:pyruvate,orthophosphate dikinase